MKESWDMIVERCEDCKWFEEIWDEFEGCGGMPISQKIDERCRHWLNKNQGKLREDDETISKCCPLF